MSHLNSKNTNYPEFSAKILEIMEKTSNNGLNNNLPSEKKEEVHLDNKPEIIMDDKEIIKFDKSKKCLNPNIARFTKQLPSSQLQLPKFIQYQKETEIRYNEAITKIVPRIKIIKRNIKQINHEDINYNGNEYTVCYVNSNNHPYLFVIDTEDKEKVINDDCSIRDGYPHVKGESVHLIVKGKHPGNGSVDHINRVRRDARNKNLKFASYSEQIHNQFSKKRKTILPNDCGIEPDDIPRCVTYVNTQPRGEYFDIQIYGFPNIPPNELKKKTTCRQDVPLRVKLQQAILYLKKLCDKYPEIRSTVHIDKEHEEERYQLTQEYNDILRLTTRFPPEIINANIVEYTYDCKDDYDLEDLEEDKTIHKIEELKSNGKKKDDNLPEDSGIKKSDIPKYCWYKPETETRGGKFIIESRHPKLIDRGIKTDICTSESKLLSVKEKFDMLLEYLDCLEKGLPIIKKEGPRAKAGQFNKFEVPKVENIVVKEHIEQLNNQIAKKEIIILSENDDLDNEKIKEEILKHPRKKEIIVVEEKDKKEENNQDDPLLTIDPKLSKYIRFKPSDGDHGEYYFIYGHPKLKLREKKATRTSKLISRKEKLQEILCHLEHLEQGIPYKVFETVRAKKNEFQENKNTKRLPEGWNTELYPIPECLYYRQESKEVGRKHGDGWIIKSHSKQKYNEMKHTSVSKEVSLIDKYHEAIKIIQELDNQ